MKFNIKNLLAWRKLHRSLLLNQSHGVKNENFRWIMQLMGGAVIWNLFIF